MRISKKPQEEMVTKGLRIPRAVWQKLEIMGHREGRSANAELVHVLRKHTEIPVPDLVEEEDLCTDCHIRPFNPKNGPLLICDTCYGLRVAAQTRFVQGDDNAL